MNWCRPTKVNEPRGVRVPGYWRGTFRVRARFASLKRAEGKAMQHRRLHDAGGQRTYAVVLETGEEVMDCLKRFITGERIFAAQLTGIGAFSGAVLMYFDWEKKEYQPIPVREQVEVPSLIGDVAEAP